MVFHSLLMRGAQFRRQASLSLSLVFSSLLTRGAEIRRHASLSISLSMVFRSVLGRGAQFRRQAILSLSLSLCHWYFVLYLGEELSLDARLVSLSLCVIGVSFSTWGRSLV